MIGKISYSMLMQCFLDELYTIRAHADVGDDRVPATRVNFGTAQIAAAFGCEMYIPPNNLPCAKTPRAS